jgi:hypothetical protein
VTKHPVAATCNASRREKIWDMGITRLLVKLGKTPLYRLSDKRRRTLILIEDLENWRE